MEQLDLAEPFADACDTLTEYYVNAMLETVAGDVGTREEYYRRIKVVEDIQTQIISIVNDGKMARAQLDEERKSSFH